MEAIKEITLDLLTRGATTVVDAKQNDTARKIKAHLYAGGLAFTPPPGSIVAVRYKKPDKTAGFYDALEDGNPAAVVDGNTVTVTMAEQMLTVPGAVYAEINFYDMGQKLTTFGFAVRVEASALSDAEIISNDYYNALSETVKAAQDSAKEAAQAEAAAKQAAESINPDALVQRAVDQAVKDINPETLMRTEDYASGAGIVKAAAQVATAREFGNVNYASEHWISVKFTTPGVYSVDVFIYHNDFLPKNSFFYAYEQTESSFASVGGRIFPGDETSANLTVHAEAPEAQAIKLKFVKMPLVKKIRVVATGPAPVEIVEDL